MQYTTEQKKEYLNGYKRLSAEIRLHEDAIDAINDEMKEIIGYIDRLRFKYMPMVRGVSYSNADMPKAHGVPKDLSHYYAKYEEQKQRHEKDLEKLGRKKTEREKKIQDARKKQAEIEATVDAYDGDYSEMDVLYRRFIIGMSLSKIAQAMGREKRWVCDTITEALEHLEIPGEK